jgi:hypothetical protein
MRRKPRLEMHEKEVKPGEDIEMAVVQDGVPKDLVTKLAPGSQQDWVVKVCKQY